jgi:hypothetical protein
MRTATVIAVGVLIALCALRRHDLGAAIGAVPPQAVLLVVGGGAGRRRSGGGAGVERDLDRRGARVCRGARGDRAAG